MPGNYISLNNNCENEQFSSDLFVHQLLLCAVSRLCETVWTNYSLSTVHGYNKVYVKIYKYLGTYDDKHLQCLTYA